MSHQIFLDSLSFIKNLPSNNTSLEQQHQQQTLADEDENHSRIAPPLLLTTCGFFRSLSPRFATNSDTTGRVVPAVLALLVRADTFPLTREICILVEAVEAPLQQQITQQQQQQASSSVSNNMVEPIICSLVILRLTQLRSFDILLSDFEVVSFEEITKPVVSTICSALKQQQEFLSVSLESFTFGWSSLKGPIADVELSDIIAASGCVQTFAHLREFSLFPLTPAVMQAIAEGPGASLRKLCGSVVPQQTTTTGNAAAFTATATSTTAAALSNLLEACSNLEHVELSGAGFGGVAFSLLSSLRYLKRLELHGEHLLKVDNEKNNNKSTSKNNNNNSSSDYVEFAQAFESRLLCLEHLSLTETNQQTRLSADTAMSVVSIAQHLLHLRIRMEFTAGGFAVICNKTNFPQLRELTLQHDSSRNPAYSHDERLLTIRDADASSCCLSPSLTTLQLELMQLSANTMKKLMQGQRRLTRFLIYNCRSLLAWHDDEDEDENNESDWFDDLLQCPVHKVGLCTSFAIAKPMHTRLTADKPFCQTLTTFTSRRSASTAAIQWQSQSPCLIVQAVCRSCPRLDFISADIELPIPHPSISHAKDLADALACAKSMNALDLSVIISDKPDVACIIDGLVELGKRGGVLGFVAFDFEILQKPDPLQHPYADSDDDDDDWPSFDTLYLTYQQAVALGESLPNLYCVATVEFESTEQKRELELRWPLVKFCSKLA